MISFNFNGEQEVTRAVARFADITGRSLADEIVALARLTAVELARRTQPFGNNQLARQSGESKTRSDIARVFRSPASVFAELEGKEKSEAGLFWKAHMDRDTAFMEAIMSRNSIDLSVAHKPDPEVHRSARTKNGRVHKNYRARQLVTREQSLNAYINKKARNVGFAKSGWALGADACGGHRGIPQWASSRHKGAHGGATINRDSARTEVILYNKVRYINDILPESAIQSAIADAYDRTSKRIQAMIRAKIRQSNLNKKSA
jgi:hypothetical protein